jgi:hypothetical protein
LIDNQDPKIDKNWKVSNYMLTISQQIVCAKVIWLSFRFEGLKDSHLIFI